MPFSADESGVTFKCKLNAGALQDCASGKHYSGLICDASATGVAHTVTVEGTDPAGNVGSAQYFWVCDTMNPTVS